MTDKDHLLSSQLLFARKFDRKVDSGIMDAVYQIVTPPHNSQQYDNPESYQKCLADDIFKNNIKAKYRRILVVSIGSGLGGIEKSMIELLRYLSGQGHLVDLYLWRKPGELYNSIPEQIHILSHDLRPPKRVECESLRDYLEYLRMHFALLISRPTKYFKGINNYYDVAIAFCQNGYTPYYVIDKIIARKKVMFYHHGSYPYTGKQRRMDRHYYSQYDVFATVSNANKRMIIAEFPELSRSIVVIENIINEEKINNMSRQLINDGFDNSSILRLCTVARIAHEKGITPALYAAKLIKERGVNYEWKFIGDGEDMNEMNKLLKDLGIDENCQLIGARQNPYPYMASCDIYVQPSEVEAYSITIREAACLSKPIVATNIPAILEATETVKGITFAECEPTSISEKVLYVWENLQKNKPMNAKIIGDINKNTYNKIDILLAQ